MKENNNIKNKILKYKQKYLNEKNHEKKAIYMYKISSYIQKGGVDFQEEALRIRDDFTDMLVQLRIRNQMLNEIKNKVIEHDQIMSEIFDNYRGYDDSMDLYLYCEKLQVESREVIGDVLRFGT